MEQKETTQETNELQNNKPETDNQLLKQVHPNRWFIWAIVSVVVIGVGVWGFVQYVNIEMDSEAIGNNISLSKTNKVDTLGWETYRNEKYGFEVMYPENWILFEDKLSPTVTFYSPCIFGEEHKGTSEDCLDGKDSIGIDTQVFNNSGQAEQFLESMLSTQGQIKEGIIDGNFKAFRFGSTGTVMVMVNKNGKIYSLTLFLRNRSTPEQSLAERKTERELIFDQILSTFKFIDSESEQSSCENTKIDQGAYEADIVRTITACYLRKNDIENALRGFAPDEKRENLLRSFDKNDRFEFADIIEMANLIEDFENLKMFKYEENSERFVEFSMVKDSTGNWLITNW